MYRLLGTLVLLFPISLCQLGTTDHDLIGPLSVLEKQLHEGDLVRARQSAEQLLALHPGSPRANFALAKILEQTTEEEEMEKVLDIGLKVLAMSDEEVPGPLLTAVASFTLNVAHNSNKGKLMEQAASAVLSHRGRRQLPDRVKQEALVQLGEQLLLTGQLEKAEQLLLVQANNEVEKPGILLGLLQVLLLRMKERRQDGNQQESEELLGRLEPGSEEEMQEAKDLLQRIQAAFDKEREIMAVELDETMELMVELGIYPSKYQRVPMYEAGLTAQSLWSLEQLGAAGEQLSNLENQWEVLREEALQLVESHNWTMQQNGVWTRGEPTLEQEGKWQQLVFSGLGYPQLPDQLCSTAPTLCSLAAQIPTALSCPSGQIKLSVLQGSAHVRPHCGLTNTKLRAHLPLLVPQDTPPRLRVADQHVQLKEGNMIVFDDSFECEVWNESHLVYTSSNTNNNIL